MLPCFDKWFLPALQLGPRPDVLGIPTSPKISVCWGSLSLLQPVQGSMLGVLVASCVLSPHFPARFRLLCRVGNLVTPSHLNRRQPRDGLHICGERSWGGECHEQSMPGGRAVYLWLQPCCAPQGPASGLAVGRLRGQHRLWLPLRQGIRGRTRKGTNPRQGLL